MDVMCCIFNIRSDKTVPIDLAWNVLFYRITAVRCWMVRSGVLGSRGPSVEHLHVCSPVPSWGQLDLPPAVPLCVYLRGRLRVRTQIYFALNWWPQTVLNALWVVIYMCSGQEI